VFTEITTTSSKHVYWHVNLNHCILSTFTYYRNEWMNRQEHSENENLRQLQNVNQKWFGIRIQIFGLISHLDKYGTHRPLTVWEMQTKCPKILYSAMAKKMKTWSGIHRRIQITTKCQSLLEGHPLHTPAKFVDVCFRTRQYILFTLWQYDRITDRTIT